MKNYLKYILISLIFIQLGYSQVKGAPSFYGAGAYTTGGRGGVVLHVTNLLWNDSPGSLKWALEQNYTRTIVFDVSGIITIPNDGTIYSGAKGNVTIAGHTAPEGGITIYGEPLRFYQQDNVIIRYIKFRKPGESSFWDWCLLITHSSDVVVDHCSFAYSEEMALSGGTDYNDGNVTYQNNLFTECKDAILLGSSSNTNIQMGGFSILNNAYVNTGWRAPAKMGGACSVDLINNAIHNWWAKVINNDGTDWKLNLIGNYFQTGAQTLGQDASWGGHTLFRMTTNDTMSPEVWDEDTVFTIYDEGGANEYDPAPAGYPADISLAWQPMPASSDPIKSEWFRTSRLPLLGATPNILPSSQVLSAVLPNAGANKYLNADGTVSTYRDPIDTDAIYNFENEVSKSYAANWTDIANNGLPTMPTNTRPAGYDTDNDGMPDTWETATFGDLTRDGTGDLDADGYTDLEEFLNLVDGTPVVTYPPTNLASSNITTTGFTVSWDAITEATTYNVYIGGSLVSNVSGGTTYNATGLTQNTSYNVYVTSVNASSEEIGTSSTLQVTTSATATVTIGGKISPLKRTLILN